MWPWGHAAVAYLLYSATSHARRDRTPDPVPAVAVGVGSQIPDLVDKPLAWWFSVLPTGRTFAHSLLVAVPIVLVLWWAFDGSRDVVVALGVGWVSHTLVDVVPSLATGDWASARFPFWPVLSVPAYEAEQTLTAHLLGLDPNVQFVVELGVVLLALAVWRRDGYPGLDVVRR